MAVKALSQLAPAELLYVAVPEHETVTLLNRSAQEVNLDGWSLIDRLGWRMTLGPSIVPPGEAIRIAGDAPIQLGNRGGTITLLDTDGLKVDGVAYTAGQASDEGTTIIF